MPTQRAGTAQPPMTPRCCVRLLPSAMRPGTCSLSPSDRRLLACTLEKPDSVAVVSVSSGMFFILSICYTDSLSELHNPQTCALECDLSACVSSSQRYFLFFLASRGYEVLGPWMQGCWPGSFCIIWLYFFVRHSLCLLLLSTSRIQNPPIFSNFACIHRNRKEFSIPSVSSRATFDYRREANN